MVIIVIGLGSMGRRRVRMCLSKLAVPAESIVGVDSRHDRCEQASDEFRIKTFSELEQAIALHKPSHAFVCTAPLQHCEIIPLCLNAGMHVFSEINLVADGYEKIIALAEEKNLKLFLSSTPLYRKEMEIIIEKTSRSEEPLNYIYHVGQYLPDWHPWEDIQDFFVSDKRTNGCREIFAIELPWLIKAFGPISNVSVQKSKNSKLPLDYCDNYIVTLNHGSGHKGVFCVDIISRKPVRELRVIGEHLSLSWGGTPDSLTEYNITHKVEVKLVTYNNIDKNENYGGFIIENMYVDEIKAFFEYTEHGEKPRYSFEEDIEILKLIDRIEGVKV